MLVAHVDYATLRFLQATPECPLLSMHASPSRPESRQRSHSSDAKDCFHVGTIVRHGPLISLQFQALDSKIFFQMRVTQVILLSKEAEISNYCR